MKEHTAVNPQSCKLLGSLESSVKGPCHYDENKFLGMREHSYLEEKKHQNHTLGVIPKLIGRFIKYLNLINLHFKVNIR